MALFNKNGYDLDQFKGWTAADLSEAAIDEGLIKAPGSVKKAVAKAKVGVVTLLQGMSLSEATRSIANGEVTKIPLTKGTRVINCHSRDDMAIAPDANIAWQSRGDNAEFNDILRDVCAEVIKLKGKSGIPTSAKAFAITDHVKKGSGFEGPYFRAGNFIYREHSGNASMVCAFPVSVLNKYYGASIK